MHAFFSALQFGHFWKSVYLAVTRIELVTKVLFENEGFDARSVHTTYALNDRIAFTKLLKSDRFLLPSGSTVSNLGYFHLFLIKSKAS